MDEFSLINSFFKPLAQQYDGSLNLTDDAAIITTPDGCDLVVTKDAICSGVHFLGDEDAALIARKLLRINLSDLAAMGAKPLAYLLSIQLPKDISTQWVQRFAEGLKHDQNEFGIHLAGGDTTSSHGPVACSITAFGATPSGKALRRSQAKVGDIIYVSGTLGDSALGLAFLQNRSAEPNPFLIDRYLVPQPRVELGQRLIGFAHAAMDISDGLMQDLGHICKASGVGATLYRHQLPLSAAAKPLLDADNSLWDSIYAGGDDYELLFTAPVDKQAEITTLSIDLKLAITPIGHITTGSEVILEDEQGNVISVPRKGFAHF